MGIDFTARENRVLYGLLAESSDDIVLKTDRDGFILHASPSIRCLGFRPEETLIWPHLLDLVHPSRADAVKAELMAAIGGARCGQWVEFPALTLERGEQWFELRSRPLARDDGRIYGALSVMRSIDQRKLLEAELFAASMTDSLTGLTNRKAFTAMLQHLVDDEGGGCLALFDIGYFKSINWRYGQSVGDRVLVAFSDLLRKAMRRDDIISRIGTRTLGVLLPRTTPERALAACRQIIEVLAEIRDDACSNCLAITASAGVSRIHGTSDDTVRRAELALFQAKSRGPNQVEFDDRARLPWTSVPRAAA
jgi:diguanylate cyclase (GGDEF)-like protein/PAS domain S-box-containing protein